MNKLFVRGLKIFCSDKEALYIQSKLREQALEKERSILDNFSYVTKKGNYLVVIDAVKRNFSIDINPSSESFGSILK